MHRVPLAGEGLVGHDSVVPGVVDQGVARDAGGGLVGPAEAAVNDNQLAAALDGAFALAHLHGNVTVDDVAVLALEAEFHQEPVTDPAILIVGVVGVFRLRPGSLVRDKPPLEGGHPISAENGAVPARPQPPQEVHAELPLLGTPLVVVGFSGGFLGIVQKPLAAALFAADGEGH